MREENPYAAPKAQPMRSHAPGARHHWFLRCSIRIVTATSFFLALAFALVLGVLWSVGTDMSPFLPQCLLVVLLAVGGVGVWRSAAWSAWPYLSFAIALLVQRDDFDDIQFAFLCVVAVAGVLTGALIARRGALPGPSSRG